MHAYLIKIQVAPELKDSLLQYVESRTIAIEVESAYHVTKLLDGIAEFIDNSDFS